MELRELTTITWCVTVVYRCVWRDELCGMCSYVTKNDSTFCLLVPGHHSSYRERNVWPSLGYPTGLWTLPRWIVASWWPGGTQTQGSFKWVPGESAPIRWMTLWKRCWNHTLNGSQRPIWRSVKIRRESSLAFETSTGKGWIGWKGEILKTISGIDFLAFLF